MEIRNVRVYDNIVISHESNSERFYNFCYDSSEKLDLSEFLNSVQDFEDENGETSNSVYGIVQEKIVKEFQALVTFHSIRNNKDYLVYTDNQKDQNGKLIVYCLTYKEKDPDPFVGFLTTQEEWAEVCSLLDAVFLKH